MKFLFCAPRYHTNFFYPIQALLNHGHEARFLALYRGQSESYDNLEPKILGYSKVFQWLNRRLNPGGGKLIKNSFELKYGYPPVGILYREIKRANPDVVVVKDLSSFYSLITLGIARLLGKKVIAMVQIPKFREKKKSYSVAAAGALFGTRVVTPVLGDVRFPNRNKNLSYIPFVYDVKDFKKEYFKNGAINVLSVGKLQERKGQLLLLEAVRALRKDYNIYVTLVGQEDEEVYTRRVEQYIAREFPAGTVEIKRNLPWDRVVTEYKSHDLFVLPSYSEAAAYAPIEAMSYKLPVIISDDNGTKCYIEPGRNGYVFRRRDQADLTDKILMIIRDKANVKKMGEESFRLAKERHSLDSFYVAFTGVINR